MVLVNGKVSLLPASCLKEVHLEFPGLQSETSRSLANHRTMGSLLLQFSHISTHTATNVATHELLLHDEKIRGLWAKEILANKTRWLSPLSALAFQDVFDWIPIKDIQFRSVQLLSHVQLFATP